MKLLLAEDEHKLASALSLMLKKNGYVTDIAPDGEIAIEMAATGVYDLLVLDRMLPRRNGLSVLQEYRKLGYNNPVIFLTALDSIQDRIEGLDNGADDYLIKPFSISEFLARLRSLSRRSVLAETRATQTLTVAGITLDTIRNEVNTARSQVKLTVKESLILELLMRNHGQTIPTDRILEKVWGEHSALYRPYVHLYVHYLRKKLPDICVRTIHEVGYCLQ